jgi:CRISPR/Cas system-associated exonuclease Cas4 (RecB family)
MTESGSRKIRDSRKDIISASELAEYDYCSLSWYFTKEGYPATKESSQAMNRGTVAHRQVHEDLEKSSKMSVYIIVAIFLVILFMIIVFI